jgi:hypothetical protein
MYASRYAMKEILPSLRGEIDAVQSELLEIAVRLDPDDTIREARSD